MALSSCPRTWPRSMLLHSDFTCRCVTGCQPARRTLHGSRWNRGSMSRAITTGEYLDEDGVRCLPQSCDRVTETSGLRRSAHYHGGPCSEIPAGGCTGCRVRIDMTLAWMCLGPDALKPERRAAVRPEPSVRSRPSRPSVKGHPCGTGQFCGRRGRWRVVVTARRSTCALSERGESRRRLMIGSVGRG